MPSSPPDGPPLTIDDAGHGPAALVLHGGGGPATVAPIAAHLTRSMRVLTPTLPGWNGTARPAWMTGIDDIAIALLDHVRDAGLTDVTVIGSSLGGWLGAEMAVRDRGATLSRLVLIDAVGIEVPGEPMTDFFGLDMRGIVEHSFHDPDRFFVDPASIPPEQAAVQQANVENMRVLAGDPYMHDPKLRRRLARVALPALAIWGDSDRIVTPAYGRAFADAFADGSFVLIPDAGHLPQLEAPEPIFAAIDAFLDA